MASTAHDAHDTPQHTLDDATQPVVSGESMASAQPGERARGVTMRDNASENTGDLGGEVIPQESHKMELYPTKKYENTRGWLPAFLAALAEYPNITKAAAACGVSRMAVYDAMRADPSLKQVVHDHYAAGAMMLEDVAMDRVLNGVERRIYHKGGTEEIYREYPERLHIELLRANNAKYRQASQAGSTNTSYNLSIHFSGPPPAQLAPSMGPDSATAGDVIEGDVVDGDQQP